MDKLLPAAAAFVCGCAAEFINYLITKAWLKNKSSSVVLVLRTLITGLFIAALFFIGSKCACGHAPLLIGGALGCTAGIIIFTLLLARQSRVSSGDTGEEDNNG